MSTLQRRRLLFGSRAFSPSDIAGLAGWWKADAISGLADGDPVASWLDSSGNGRTFSQATAAKKPTFKTGIVNGMPVVRFDGVDDLLKQAAFGLAAGGSSGSLYTVQKVTGYAVGVTPIILDTRTWDAVPNTVNFFLASSPYHGVQPDKLIVAGRYDAGVTTNIVYGDENVATGAWEIWEAHSNGSAWSVFRNGRLQALTVSAGTNVGQWVGLSTTGSVGSGLTLGGTAVNAVEGNWFNGDLAEGVLYNTVTLNATQQLQVRGYLAAKYAVPVV